jgi:hypothetical protein
VSEGAAMYHELRKRGTSLDIGGPSEAMDLNRNGPRAARLG